MPWSTALGIPRCKITFFAVFPKGVKGINKIRVLAFALAVALLLAGCNKGETPQEQPDDQPLAIAGHEYGISVNGAYYGPDDGLSQTAGEENVGELVGDVTYVFRDKKTQTGISAYRYLPDDGQTNRIIFFDETFWVCSFGIYIPDGTDTWPKELLKNACYIEIVGTNHPIKGPGEKVTVTDAERVGQIVKFLSDLGEKHNQAERNQRYYELFKDHFEAGAIWIDENGNLAANDTDVRTRLSNMIQRNDRDITVVMNDNTKLCYTYRMSSDEIYCYDFSYFLTEAQTEQIRQIVAWE